ncbi:hypothetical protein [Candidatus Mycoplasma haematohominis]|uniref:Uncharacterized protein n=1 Tax=Candidatus Mycoplasma haematohominis TaxID=1494318 RepID=A0A478FP35_9MOLU|nr:hypothetical protein [Candidatus Mycoplasma haemohominis]GCE63068.1 hypothetical protein MHSWG343_00460 [Candidatus Mycoplasma haemohominis]
MASPAVIGAGVVGGTAAVGATSVAAYHAFNKDGETKKLEEPSQKVGKPGDGSPQTEQANNEEQETDKGRGSEAPSEPSVVNKSPGEGTNLSPSTSGKNTQASPAAGSVQTPESPTENPSK